MRSALIASRAAAITFPKAATLYIEAHEASWKNAKHRQQGENTLNAYAKPEIGSLLVRDVELPQVLKVLEPIWKEKTETASRLRGRVESVLDWATARGYRTGPKPARWKGQRLKVSRECAPKASPPPQRPLRTPPIDRQKCYISGELMALAVSSQFSASAVSRSSAAQNSIFFSTPL